MKKWGREGGLAQGVILLNSCAIEFLGTQTGWTRALLWVIDHLCPMWTAVAPWVEYKEKTFHQYTVLMETQAEEDGQDRIRRAQGFDTRIKAAQQEVEAAQASLPAT